MSKDELLHIRVGKQLKKDIDELIDIGIFSSQTELAREAIRSLVLRYKQQYQKEEKEEAKK
ncbi:MAG: ribbon-helix-helix domain-containing protein [Candidatus Woesearchaeota archaeon]